MEGGQTEDVLLYRLWLCVCVCEREHVPAVLFAAVAEEPFLLAAARAVDAAFGAGGCFSVAPLSGVCQIKYRRDKLWRTGVNSYVCAA